MEGGGHHAPALAPPASAWTGTRFVFELDTGAGGPVTTVDFR